MITAILLGFLGLFLGMVGLRCTNVGNMDLSKKAKLLAIAGAFHILAGNGGQRGPTGWGVPHLPLSVDPCPLCLSSLLSTLPVPCRSLDHNSLSKVGLSLLPSEPKPSQI